MRVGHYYPLLFSERSGVTAAIQIWAETQRKRGHDVVFLSDSPDSRDNIRVKHFGETRITKVPWLGRSTLKSLDLLVLHEGWTPSHYVAAHAARRVGTPYVVTAHGVYEPRILRRLKPPRVLRSAAERRMLEGALGVHVFFDSEVPLVRAIAPAASMIVVPTAAPLTTAIPRSGQGGYVAWFGRYDPEHKGLDLLLSALASLPEERRPRLRLHGFDFLGGRRATEDLVATLSLAPWVDVGDPISGEAKAQFLSDALAYVHPSRWESHSVALLEVLASGTPALVSSEIHIASTLARHDAAILVSPTTEDWARSLSSLDRQGLGTMGERAAAFVQRELGYDSVGRQWDETVRMRLQGHCSR